jgi:hypothetical protein
MRPETFEKNGKKWTRYPAQPFDIRVMACDPGGAVDATALCAMRYTVEPVADDWLVDESAGSLTQMVRRRYLVEGLERFPVPMDLPDQLRLIEARRAIPELRGSVICFDYTGLGRGLAQFAEQRRVGPITKVTFSGTALKEEMVAGEARHWSVSKDYSGLRCRCRPAQQGAGFRREHQRR